MTNKFPIATVKSHKDSDIDFNPSGDIVYTYSRPVTLTRTSPAVSRTYCGIWNKMFRFSMLTKDAQKKLNADSPNPKDIFLRAGSLTRGRNGMKRRESIAFSTCICEGIILNMDCDIDLPCSIQVVVCWSYNI
ncbi:hypothetical protein EQH57_1001, partial [Dictyocoela roeselum]